MSNKELTIKEISPIVTQATNLKISDSKSMTDSVELLSQCNKYLDKLNADKKAITDPINQALKEVRAKYAPVEKPLEEAIAILRKKQSVYQTALILKERAEEDKISNRVAKGTLRPDTAVNKLETMDRVDQKIDTNAGSLSFREDKILKIVNPSLIPREYLIPDEKLILEALKSSKTVPGCEVEIIMVPVNRR